MAPPRHTPLNSPFFTPVRNILGTSRARQLGQAGALVAGHGQIVAHFFDSGQSRTLARALRPQASALVAQLADRSHADS
jgi:7-keto-8-aminopelargonate synthetase-like enzyme